MLTQTPSTPMQKLKFLFALPLVVVALVFSAFIKQHTDGLSASGNMIGAANIPVGSFSNNASLPDTKRIGKITWRGNTVFSTQTLNETFGLKEGDSYDKAEITKRLTNNLNGNDVTSLYMDKGYLFFSIDAQEKKTGNNAVNLDFTIYEGIPVKIRAIIIKGNSHIATADILKKIPISSGELFDRSKLIQAQQAIAAMGYFDPEKIQIIPLPDAKAKTVQVEGVTDLEFSLMEKVSKPTAETVAPTAEAIRLLFNGKEIDPRGGIPAHSTGYFSVDIPNEEVIKENGSKIGIIFTLARGNRSVVNPEKKLSNYRDLSSTDMGEIFSLSKPGDRLVFELTGVKNRIIRVVPIK